MAISSADIDENVAPGTSVGTFSTTDPNASDTVFTYTLVTGGADNASFTVSGNQLLTNAAINFETKSSYAINVRTTDQFGGYYEKLFTITVNNVNELPTNIALSNSSFPENSISGTFIGKLTSTDPDAGNTFIYSWAAGAPITPVLH